MALPVTITGISTAVAPVGPFKSSGGNYYFFGRDGVSNPALLRAYKSTAPDTSWAGVASVDLGAGDTINALSGYQVNDLVYIAASRNDASATSLTLSIFNCATDTFTTTSEAIVTGVQSAGQTGSLQFGCSLVVRSAGEVVAFYNGLQTKTSGTFYSRVYYSRRTAVNTWSAAVQVDANTAVDNVNPTMVLGSSDRLHFFWVSTAINQRHLTSANVLGTANTALATTSPPLDVVTINDSGTIRHVGLTAVGEFRFTSADNPTISTNLTAILGTPARGVDDSLIAYALYRDSASSDLYVKTSSDFGATWGTGAASFVATVAGVDTNLSKNQHAYQRGSLVVFPYIVNDNGTLKYNEYTVRTLAPPAAELDLTVGAVAVAGPAQTLRADRQLHLGVAAVTLVGRDTQGLKGFLLSAQKGSVTLAGSTVTLRDDRKLPLATYGVALAGQTATLRIGRKLQATTGAITLTGVDVNLRYGRGFMLTTQPGAVVVSGKNVDLIYTPVLTTNYVLQAGTGAITVAPKTAILRYGHVLTAQKGAIAVGGVPANVRRAYTLSSTVGAITLTGYPATLKYGRAFNFTAGVGAIAVSMKSATLQRNRMLPLATGSIAVSGIPADLRVRQFHKLILTPGAVTITGNSVVLSTRSDKVLGALTGAITVSGKTATLKVSRALLLAKADIRLTGYPVILSHHVHQDYRMELAPASVVVARQYADLQYGNRQPGRMTFGLRAEIPGRW